MDKNNKNNSKKDKKNKRSKKLNKKSMQAIQDLSELLSEEDFETKEITYLKNGRELTRTVSMLLADIVVDEDNQEIVILSDNERVLEKVESLITDG